MKTISGSVSVVLCGAAGQGIDTVEQLLASIFKNSGYNVFATKEFMSRIRGGMNSSTIMISSRRVRAMTERADIFVPFLPSSLDHVRPRLSPETLILSEHEAPGYNRVDVPYMAIARELGNPLYANIVGIGLVAALFNVPRPVVSGHLRRRFAYKGDKIVAGNDAAAQKGFDIGAGLLREGRVAIDVTASDSVKDEIMISGSDAVALGAIAGGCNFVAAYPMTPAVGVWKYLTDASRTAPIVSEQAEDEISAMNMAIGAWFAGGRGLVTTSGGGFDLMTEGLSLAGAMESPLVIHLAQRPGPATGLPTRTEQADLNLALHAGHGEFPRIIIAPGTIEEAFHFTRHAFNRADAYQVPVFILTDQYLMDSYYNLPRFATDRPTNTAAIVRSDASYRRYAATESGISPRSIPGYGEGIVIADCHAHDETGHISENLQERSRLVEKMLRKGRAIGRDPIMPELAADDPGYERLVVCWGSNYSVVREAVGKLRDPKTAVLHFKQLLPLPACAQYFKPARRIVDVENNATGQFADHLRATTGIEVHDRILNYTGLPFTSDKLADAIGRAGS